MGDALKRRLKQPGFENPFQEAMLNLMVATDHVRSRIDRVCDEHGITHGQYNVLRILRGVYPEGHPRCVIAERMIERAPDVTRLVDRLERQGLVERDRSAEDRRLSITRITRKGLKLVEIMAPEIESLLKDLSSRISRTDCLELSRICETLYDNQ
jgi:DNA-binding MarR family transcriptional regulator